MDCEILMDVLLETPGYWEVGDWSEGTFEPLTFLETCIVVVTRTDDHFIDNARVGIASVFNILLARGSRDPWFGLE